jgi:hypothetical protein
MSSFDCHLLRPPRDRLASRTHDRHSPINSPHPTTLPPSQIRMNSNHPNTPLPTLIIRLLTTVIPYHTYLPLFIHTPTTYTPETYHTKKNLPTKHNSQLPTPTNRSASHHHPTPPTPSDSSPTAHPHMHTTTPHAPLAVTNPNTVVFWFVITQ